MYAICPDFKIAFCEDIPSAYSFLTEDTELKENNKELMPYIEAESV